LGYGAKKLVVAVMERDGLKVDLFLGKDAALKIEKVYDKCFKLGGKTGDEDR